MNELYDQAIEAEGNGSITEWFVGYLHESGRNKVLAGGLKEDGKYHTRFIDYPLDKLKILMGPDESYRYPEDPEQFHKRIEDMSESIRIGWKPVPLIATDLWNDGLELNDGAHRAFALMNCRYQTYLTIFYFKTQKEVDDFEAAHSAGAPRTATET